MFGGSPEEQIAREAKAREWDDRVASELWGREEWTHFAPEWASAGKPPEVATSPDQSQTNPSGLAKYYAAKLARLGSIIERVNAQ